jgi:hypothetical protein
VSTDSKPEELFGLPDIGGLTKLLNDAKAFFADVQAFAKQLMELYETHKADIDELVAFAKQVVAFFRGLSGGTGGGFQGA